jgi:hypothetical protein
LSDHFSARTASQLCDKEEQLKLSYSLSENDQDARVSVLTGRATAHKATISTSKSYNLQRNWVFESKIFSELKKRTIHRARLQSGQPAAGIVLPLETVLPRSK